MNKEPLLEIQQMSKSFGPTKALQNVDMRIYRGQVRGLIGENGSGKSTISSIIAGMQPADSGKMLFKGEPYTPASMLDAAGRGIAMIVQEAGTIANITVAENIFLGKESRFGRCGFINKKKMEEAAQGCWTRWASLGWIPPAPSTGSTLRSASLLRLPVP